MYFLSPQSSQVSIYNLSTAWDISTATLSSVGNKDNNGWDFFISADGTKFFLGSYTGSVTRLDNASKNTLTFPTSVNIDGLSNANNVITPSVGYEYLYRMVTSNGGTNVTNINVGSVNLS